MSPSQSQWHPAASSKARRDAASGEPDSSRPPAQVQAVVHASGVREGLCTVMIQHTSASLIIQENADPSARRDLEEWLRRHVPEGDRHFTHTHEGADDMPSHIRSALTATSRSIPFEDGQLTLGTWQGIYL